MPGGIGRNDLAHRRVTAKATPPGVALSMTTSSVCLYHRRYPLRVISITLAATVTRCFLLLKHIGQRKVAQLFLGHFVAHGDD